MAPGVGLEPTTSKLTASCSTIELPGNINSVIIGVQGKQVNSKIKLVYFEEEEYIRRMIEKYAFDAVLSKIRTGAVKINYWDSTSSTYGKGKPYFKMTVKDPKAIRMIFKNMSVGFGESYMDKLIEIEGPLDNVGKLVSQNSQAFNKLTFAKFTRKLNTNSFSNQKQHVQHHYDLGNDFYKLWLDKSMTYSCAYFKKKSDSLELAQQQKIKHVLQKLQLKPGLFLLDIGSGWGELLFTAVKDYDIRGHGITLSQEQYNYCVAQSKKLGLDGKLSFELISYQELAKRGRIFNRIVSVGMFEHVGKKNQASYFKSVAKMLAPDGISVLHTISNGIASSTDPWIDKYIFPGGYLPTTTQVTNSIFEAGFDLLDYENLRIHYAMTLDEWFNRFEKNKQKVLKMYDEKFYRMWKLYLASSSAGFRYGDLKLSQYVFTSPNNNSLPLTRDFLYK